MLDRLGETEVYPALVIVIVGENSPNLLRHSRSLWIRALALHVSSASFVPSRGHSRQMSSARDRHPPCGRPRARVR